MEKQKHEAATTKRNTQALSPAERLRNERTILDTCMKSGTTVESLEFEKLKKLQISQPPIPEQQEIVRILDRAFRGELITA